MLPEISELKQESLGIHRCTYTVSSSEIELKSFTATPKDHTSYKDQHTYVCGYIGVYTKDEALVEKI